MHIRSRRAAALLSIGALGTGTAVAAAPAHAQLLGGLLPSIGTIVTNTGDTLGGTVNSVLPGTGGTVTGVTGSVGGIVTGVESSLTGTLDQTLTGILGGGGGGGGGGGAALPDNVLDTLLATLLGNSTAAPGTPGTGTSGGPIVLSGGSVGPGGVILDASAPRPTVKVLSKLRQIGRTGKMRIEIKTNEPGIVAVANRIRPGTAVKRKKGAKKVKHSRKLIKVPQLTLGYRRAGKLVVTVRLSRAAQRALGRSRNARMSIASVAVDVFKNQDSDNAKVTIKR